MEQGVHVTEQLPAYAIGCLDDDEVAAVEQHLDVCAACRAELDEFRRLAGRLAFAVPDAAPPAGFKERILAQAEAERAAPRAGVAAPGAARLSRVPPAAPSWRQRLAGSFRRSAPAWGLAALALAVLLVVTNLWWWQRARESTPGDMRAVAMLGTAAAPGGTGTLVISADGEYGTLVVDSLPVLDEAHDYQLWLIRDGQRTSGGVFDVSSHGYGALVVDSPQPLSTYSSFGVTVEPAGGSPGPTGDKVLGSAE